MEKIKKKHIKKPQIICIPIVDSSDEGKDIQYFHKKQKPMEIYSKNNSTDKIKLDEENVEDKKIGKNKKINYSIEINSTKTYKEKPIEDTNIPKATEDIIEKKRVCNEKKHDVIIKKQDVIEKKHGFNEKIPDVVIKKKQDFNEEKQDFIENKTDINKKKQDVIQKKQDFIVEKQDVVIKKKQDLIEKIQDVIKKKQDFIEKKQDFIENKPNVIEKKQDFIENKGDVIKKKQDFIENKGDVIKKKQDFIENKGDVIKKKQDFIENKGDVIKKKQDFIENKGDVIKKKQDFIENKGDVIKKKQDVIKKKQDFIENKPDIIKKQDAIGKDEIKHDIIEKKEIKYENKQVIVKKEEIKIEKKQDKNNMKIYTKTDTKIEDHEKITSLDKEQFQLQKNNKNTNIADGNYLFQNKKIRYRFEGNPIKYSCLFDINKTFLDFANYVRNLHQINSEIKPWIKIKGFYKTLITEEISIKCFINSHTDFLKDENITHVLFKNSPSQEPYKQLLFDINNFKKVRYIGQGGNGKVYIAQNNLTNKLYAVKCLFKTHKSSENVEVDNIEIMILKNLNYPTIIKLYGYSLSNFEGDDSISIFMTLGQEKSLGEYLSENRKKSKKILSNTDLQIILIGIAAGMNYLHSKSIMHRDLKPDNILLDENKYALITDFGISKIFMEGKEHTPGLGTPIYQAPEILEDKEYDLKIDIYSFGLILYEIVTDLIPYEKFSLFKLMTEVLNGYRPPIDKSVNPYLKNMIVKCLSHNPKERPPFTNLLQSLAFDKNYYLDNVDSNKVLSYAKNVLKL